MREIFSFIFEQLTDPLVLPISPLYEHVILIALNLIAYKIAYSAVGGMYRIGEISSKTAGSACHWLIRLAVYVVIWAITNGIIELVKLIMEHWVVIVSALGGILLIAGIITIVVILNKKVKHYEKNEK